MKFTLPATLDSYRLLGKSGLRVSPLCLGTMTFGKEWGWGSTPEEAKEIFDIYTEAGGNFFDTADFYTGGTSEKLLGKFIASERERFVVATKYSLSTRRGDPNAGGNHRKNMVQSVEASLRRLGTDYIDLYWLHVWDNTTPIDEIMRGLDDLVRAGKVLYIAISDTPAWQIARMNTLAELRGLSRFIALQIEYNLVRRDAERDLIPMAQELGLGVLPWSPLAGGVLTGKYSMEDLKRQQTAAPPATPFGQERRLVKLTEKRLKVADTVKDIASEIGRTPAQVALNWLLLNPAVVSPIIGARTPEQLKDNLASLEFRLDQNQIQRLEEVSAIEPGFPHDFLKGQFVQDFLSGGCKIIAG
ncbi:MAG: aldo/keto reductase [Candidatus Dadabacteria bacterium]|nr:MAG: aldo/keto reductase [Candidatus Dadabacteria bacterium]